MLEEKLPLTEKENQTLAIQFVQSGGSDGKERETDDAPDALTADPVTPSEGRTRNDGEPDSEEQAPSANPQVAQPSTSEEEDAQFDDGLTADPVTPPDGLTRDSNDGKPLPSTSEEKETLAREFLTLAEMGDELLNEIAVNGASDKQDDLVSSPDSERVSEISDTTDDMALRSSSTWRAMQSTGLRL